MRWSRLRILLSEVVIPEVEFFCSSYRREGGPPLGRYWVKLLGESVWQVPADFSEQMKERAENREASAVTAILREYLDLPRERLLDEFSLDPWGLQGILRASDRRIGQRRLNALESMLRAREHHHRIALRIIHLRREKKHL